MFYYTEVHLLDYYTLRIKMHGETVKYQYTVCRKFYKTNKTT
jgi:hypothetical protein